MVIAREWQAVEITFTSSQVYANPFLDVDVTAVFVAPSGATLTRPGFWDGGDVWKVRMAPTELGLWRYRITASDPTNAGLNPPEGQVISLPYRGDLAIFRHGFLKTSANGRYLAYADSSPFFWLADTHWFFDSKERWDSANKLGWASEFKGIVDRRVAQHFTVYQSVIFGPSPTYWAPGQVGELIAPEYFRDNLDRKMQYIADQGLVNAFGLGFSENIDGQVATQVRLARYVVARYGAYPIVWFTGGEVAGYDPGLRQSRVDGWRQVALEIDREDAYHQPQTAHYTSGWPLDYQGESWLDFTMVQGAHGSLPPLQVYANYYDRSPAIPLLEGELNYEQIYPVVDDALVRASAYRAIQAGSFGYSYGAEGIWNAVWDNTDTSGDASYAHWNWYDAIDFPGGAQMGYMADFYTRLAWETLAPRPTGWAQWSLSQPDQAMPAIKADDEANNIVVYFPEQYNPQSAAGSLGPLPDQVYQVRWFNPRTGAYTVLGAAKIDDDQWVVETKPDPGDWVLWLQAIQPGPLPAPVPSMENLALGQDYHASSQSDAAQSAAQAFDGNSSTSWQAAPGLSYSDQWLEVDFGRAVSLNTAVISENGYRTRGYRIEYWTGEDWQLAARGTLIGGSMPAVLSFSPVTTTQVRLRFTAGVSSPSIRELEFYYQSPLEACRPADLARLLHLGQQQGC